MKPARATCGHQVRVSSADNGRGRFRTADQRDQSHTASSLGSLQTRRVQLCAARTNTKIEHTDDMSVTTVQLSSVTAQSINLIQSSVSQRLYRAIGDDDASLTALTLLAEGWIRRNRSCGGKTMSG
ncbi:hypothetical protein BaRGS_00038321 [Batillaria attramentaria]|uniref:Uncharacterized protein n=1 Tax=Batillaria attramentaria TaxID=370345 RepID=A0ABD0J6D7_9CAEN